MSENTETPKQVGDVDKRQADQPDESGTVTVEVPPEVGTQTDSNLNDPGIDSHTEHYNYGFFKRPLQYDPIMIVFTLILFAGGLVAYMTKQSAASLVASTVFAIFLSFSIYLEGSRKNSYPLLVSLVIVTATFVYRFSLSSHFIPSGLFALLSILMLARHCYLLYLRRRAYSSA